MQTRKDAKIDGSTLEPPLLESLQDLMLNKFLKVNSDLKGF